VKLGIVVPMIYLPSIENSAVVLLLLLLLPLHLQLKTGKLFAGARFHQSVLELQGSSYSRVKHLFQQSTCRRGWLGVFFAAFSP